MSEHRSTWWTPEGWINSEAPDQYVKALEAAAECNNNWVAMLEAGGFTKHHSGDSGEGAEGEDFGLYIYECTKGKVLLVEVWNDYEEVGYFFVNSESIVPFFAEWLPEFKARRAQCLLALETKMIREALIAFIRHGHGRQVIDTYGDTLDDYEFRAEAAARRREEKRKAAEAKK